jgi:hypothetical protein
VYPAGKGNVKGVGAGFCLGMIHGHWDIRESEMDSPYPKHDPKQGVNMGIAIVVPAIKITETLNRPELVSQRKGEDDEFLRSLTPTMD